MRNDTNRQTLNSNHVEEILGQFIFAFGQGAGAMRVQRRAIAAFRARYYEPIRLAPGQWKSVSSNVLGFVAQVGRLAAHFATEAGRTSIGEGDFVRARQIVEKNVHQHADVAPVLIAGPFCSVVPGEAEPTSPQPSPIDPAVVADPAPAKRAGESIH